MAEENYNKNCHSIKQSQNKICTNDLTLYQSSQTMVLMKVWK